MNHLRDFFKDRISLALGISFLLLGFTFGSWASTIPYLMDRLMLDEAQLGMLLLMLPAGVIIMNLGSVPLLVRLGASNLTLITLPLTALLFTIPHAVPGIILTGLSLFVAGASFSTANMAVNTCTTNYEDHGQVKIISTAHGLWSVGAMLGAAVSSLLVGIGIHPSVYGLGLFCAILIAVFLFLLGELEKVPRTSHLHEIDENSTPRFVMPNAALWLLIVISICVNLTEGTMVDWSSVYMAEVVHAPETMIGFGYAVFAFFMSAGRFFGDALASRFSGRRVLLACGVLAFLGLNICIWSSSVSLALTGCAIIGAGVSMGAPMLYAAASRVQGMGQGVGLATMNTFAMMGYLGGPALLGFIARNYSLQTAFGVVALATVIWIGVVRFKVKSQFD